MKAIHCRHFSGYKPCGLNETCDSVCPSLDPIHHRVLVVSLEAMGSVLRSTVLLHPIRRKYPKAHITWVTQKESLPLLTNNPLIDRLIAVDLDGLLSLSALRFDVAFVVDKSLKVAGILRQTEVREIFGFTVDAYSGAVMPANVEAHELWEVGLSDDIKFHRNQKTEVQLLLEAMALASHGPASYVLELTTPEEQEVALRRSIWGKDGRFLVGINTGCSGVIPYKKLSFDGHLSLIQRLSQHSHLQVVLLGGASELELNQELARKTTAVVSRHGRGLRDGVLSVAACDVVFSGDTLGMHIAIALEKFTVTWFGPTCSQEIDLFGRGRKVLTKANCSPCWKRSCSKELMCYDQVRLDELEQAILEGVKWTRSSFKPHFSEIYS